MSSAAIHENYETLLSSHLGLYNSQILIPQDRAVLVGSLLAEGEFEYVPQRDSQQLRILHRQIIGAPNFPRNLLLTEGFMDCYYGYAPKSTEFDDSIVAKSRSRLASLAPEDRKRIEQETAPALVDAIFSDSRVRRVLESPPVTAYRQSETTLCIDQVEIPVETDTILEYGTGIREAVRRTHELQYGVFSKVTQIGSRTFPGYVAHHMLLRTGAGPYERIAKDIAQGSDELVDRHAKNDTPGFGVVVMAQSAEVSSLDQATQAISNARKLCDDGAFLVIRDAVSAYYRGHGFNDLTAAAQEHFGDPIDLGTLRQRRNINNPVQLAVFKAG